MGKTGVKPTKPTGVLLVDADILVYRYGLMKMSPLDFDDYPENTGEDTQLSAARNAFKWKLDSLLRDTGVPTLKLAMASSRCFRYKFFPQYKQHRGETPQVIKDLKKCVRGDETLSFLSAIPIPEGETDDILGYYHKADGSTCVVSNDKDFLTLPGWNYHPFTGQLVWVTHKMAYVARCFQALVGDSADGIPGCKGIGKSRARRILTVALTEDPNCDLYSIAKRTFTRAGHPEDDFWISLSLITVDGKCRTPDQLKEQYYASN